MKKIFNKITVIGYCLMVVGLTSCEDKLDINQHGVTPSDKFYQTDTEIEEAAAALYTNLRDYLDKAQQHKNWLSDDTWCGGDNHWNSGTAYPTCDYTFGSNNSDLSTMFKNLYKTVYAANVIMENVSDETATGKRAIAEAHTLRALAYFELTSMWGTPPLIDHTLSSDEYAQTNSKTEDLWAFIENDLKAAINSGALTQKTSLNAVNYRATHQFAQALLGKAYLFQKKYSEALPLFEEVINSGKYALYQDYNNIMMMSADGNCENIFEINIPFDTKNDDGVTGAQTTWTVFGPTAKYFDMTGSTTDISSKGWGFMNPTRDLYDAFVADNGVDGYRLKCTLKTLTQYRDEDGVVCILSPLLDHEGLIYYKFRYLDSEIEPNASWGQQSAKNYRWMRLADVLLMAAEAAVQSGNNAKALDYVNRVRERAQSPLLTNVTIEDIKKERRLELCGEMVRWQDLIRWGDANKVLKNKGRWSPDWNVELIKDDNGKVIGYGKETVTMNEIYGADNCGFKERHWLLPFPADEISVNPNLKQNPGW